MVLLDDNRALRLLWPLRRSASAEKKGLAGEDNCGDYERAFDIADSMEKGFARELVSDFTRPLRQSQSLWRFCVKRSEDRLQYRLYCEAGEFLLYAKVSNDFRHVDFFLYDPRERENELYDPEKPAFTMTTDAKRTEWKIMQARSDECWYSPKALQRSVSSKREVLCVRHTRRPVGSGISNCMEVFLPTACDEASPEAWGADGGARNEEQMLITKMPVWNDEVESLVLDFKGRSVQPSAKNFQLATAERPKEVVCQYAKIGPNSFGLDFRYPMTVIQAFGSALTTLLWV